MKRLNIMYLAWIAASLSPRALVRLKVVICLFGTHRKPIPLVVFQTPPTRTFVMAQVHVRIFIKKRGADTGKVPLPPPHGKTIDQL